MSILKPKEETVDISSKEIKELIFYGGCIGVSPDSIHLKVKVEFFNGLSYFNDSPIEKATIIGKCKFSLFPVKLKNLKFMKMI